MAGNTSQKGNDSLRALTRASWLLLGLNRCSDTVELLLLAKFLCSIECFKQSNSGWEIHAMFLRLPSEAKLILSVMQSNSALHYEHYLGTISILLVPENKILSWTERVCGAWPRAEISHRDANGPPGCENSSLCPDKLTPHFKQKWHISEYCTVISSPNNVIM